MVNVLRGCPTVHVHQVVSRGGLMVMYREVCPEGVQNKCPGGYSVEALCPGGIP